MTELVFILDRSGSMHGLETDTIGGFNSMIAKQRTQPGDAYVTTVLFNSRSTVIHDRLPLTGVPALTNAEYAVGGTTALLDAVGSTIRHIANIHKYARPEDVPEKTLFVITTDGMENASREYTYDKVKALIEHEQSKYGWEFLFLGANINAAREGARFGIAPERTATYKCDAEGTALNYEVIGEAVEAVRACRPLQAGWNARINADVKKRGR